MSPEFHSRSSPFEDDKRESFQHKLVEVLADIILPLIHDLPDIISPMERMIDDLFAHGYPIEPTFPGLIRLKPERMPELMGRLRRSLASINEEPSNAAVDAIKKWLEDDNLCYRYPPPADLIREIALIISGRRPSNLDSALKLTEWMIRKKREFITDDFIQELIHGLQYLLEEIAYRPIEQLPSPMTPKRILQYRKQCARLAATIYTADCVNIPILIQWIKTAYNDPLQEVRAMVKEIGKTNIPL